MPMLAIVVAIWVTECEMPLDSRCLESKCCQDNISLVYARVEEECKLFKDLQRDSVACYPNYSVLLMKNGQKTSSDKNMCGRVKLAVYRLRDECYKNLTKGKEYLLGGLMGDTEYILQGRCHLFLERGKKRHPFSRIQIVALTRRKSIVRGKESLDCVSEINLNDRNYKAVFWDKE